MSARDPVQAGLDAYVEAIALGASRDDAYRACFGAHEAAYGHLDAAERADLRIALGDAAHAAGLWRSGIEHAVGLPDRALSDGSSSTAELRAALAKLREARP